jgi:predicted nuclease of predicted toxin-antitoxin system
MRLLANENFPLKSALILKAAGFDVKVVGVEFAGITDREVLEIAIREERTIVTFDRHYGELIFRHGYRPPSGVIYLWRRQFGPQDPGRYLLELLRNTSIDFSHALTVIDEDTIRQRGYGPENRDRGARSPEK